MQDDEKKFVVAFLEIAEAYLTHSKNCFGTYQDVDIPLNQRDFDRAVSLLELINEQGKERKIYVEIEGEEKAKEAYGHTRAFKIHRIE